MFFEQLFHPGTEQAPNPLWSVDEATKFCWPRRTHPSASADARAFIERVWFQIGVVLGLAVYNNQWVALGQPLPPHIFFAMLKREAITYEDFGAAWPLVDKRLQGLVQVTTPDEWTDMDLHHVISGDALMVRGDDNGAAAAMRAGTAPLFDMLLVRPAQWDLVPGGENLPVSRDPASLGQYTNLYWKHTVGHDWYLNHHGDDASVVAREPANSLGINVNLREMLRGMATLVGAHDLDMFATHELVSLFAFRSIQNLTLEQMRRQTEFEVFLENPDTLAQDVEYIEWFWSIVEGWSGELRARLLQFVTSDRDFARQMISGAGTWRLQRGPTTDTSLPTASTCFKTLLLPVYTTRALLEARLRLAVENAEGFGLE